MEKFYVAVVGSAQSTHKNVGFYGNIPMESIINVSVLSTVDNNTREFSV